MQDIKTSLQKNIVRKMATASSGDDLKKLRKFPIECYQKGKKKLGEGGQGTVRV